MQGLFRVEKESQTQTFIVDQMGNLASFKNFLRTFLLIYSYPHIFPSAAMLLNKRLFVLIFQLEEGGLERTKL